MIRSHNVSLEILKSGRKQEGSEYLRYKELWYDCISCIKETYSLDGSYFAYTVYPENHFQNTSDGSHGHRKETIWKEILCNECSFGGSCSEGNIYPKLNHWGIVRDGRVQFYKCPGDYCCKKPVCKERYDTCAINREGVLCGTCSANYSEALFSKKCIPNEKCNSRWMFVMTFVLAMLYALFLLFQNDLKDFLVGTPVQQTTQNYLKEERLQSANSAYVISNGLQQTGIALSSQNLSNGHLKSDNGNGATFGNNNDSIDIDANIDKNENSHDISDNSQNTNDESGIFLILFFYYFQDASIVYVKPAYADVEKHLMVTLKDIAGGLFKFQLDLSMLVSNVCLLPDVTPVLKLVLKLLFHPILFTILIVIALTAHILKKSKKERQRKFGRTLSRKVATAMMFAMLFSYQSVASSMFSLINCVEVDHRDILFLDGNISCYQAWQVAVLIAVCLCLIPFSFYIMLAPDKLGKCSY